MLQTENELSVNLWDLNEHTEGFTVKQGELEADLRAVEAYRSESCLWNVKYIFYYYYL